MPIALPTRGAPWLLGNVRRSETGCLRFLLRRGS